MQTRNGDEQPRELGWKGSFVVGCGIGTACLVVIGLVVFFVGRGKEEERRSRTEKVLHIDLFEAVSQRGAPAADGTKIPKTADWRT